MHTYQLNDAGALAKSITSDGYETKYSYDDNQILACVTQSDKSECHFGFHGAEAGEKIKFVCAGIKQLN